MADRPIIFSAPMIHALLDGRKTMTRRLAWRDPIAVPDDAADYWRGRGARVSFADDTDTRLTWLPSPWQRVQPGDRLWVREAWATHWANDNLAPSDISPMHWSVRYLADDHVRRARDGSLAEVGQCKKGRPSIRMPRWASRLTLTVTAVRVEHLQDISEADAVAEGAYPPPAGTDDDGMRYDAGTSRDGFRGIWNSLHGEGAWAANPEVVAITFSVDRRNIDAGGSGDGC